MKKTFNYFVALTLLAGVVTFSSCDEDDPLGILTDTTTTQTFDVELRAKSTDAAAQTKTVSVGSKQKVKTLISFVDPDGKMERLYVTENLNGQGAKPFDFNALLEDKAKKGTKGDGSLNLQQNKDSVVFTLDLNVPKKADGSAGNAVYTFWATSGKGDFRNSDKRQLVKPAIITLKGGGVDETALLTDSIKDLHAPLANATSETFVSSLDCEVYTIKSGIESAEFWDFGYYYGSEGKASLASAKRYPSFFQKEGSSTFVNIVDFIGNTELKTEDLHVMYFKKSTAFDAAGFDAAAKFTDLNSIDIEKTDANGRINNLSVGDIVEFIDNYDKKGLIRIKNITGTNGSTGRLSFDIKIQP